MFINVKFAPSMVGSDHDLKQSSVVVIDTLRATSTIIAALMAGAREVIAAATIEEAVAISHRLGTERTLLGGERGGVRIKGFHLGNSPGEYTPEVVHGKTIILTTSNGSGALLKARQAAQTLCGALLNASAVARHLAAGGARDVLLLCSGSGGNVSLEDSLAAGAILAELLAVQDSGSVTISDGARIALWLFNECRNDLPAALRASEHGRALMELGFTDDLDYCARLDIPDAPVPAFAGSSIKVQQSGPAGPTVARFV
ncbi:MAG TPA: 2-phosphosulfolactate phosphatase [Candidatus Kapabacteria bacterium]|nr:2-phosphosulfolactate phosphatase [Candidatus Kapabacteria bacterium]